MIGARGLVLIAGLAGWPTPALASPPSAEAPIAPTSAERIRGDWAIVLSDQEKHAIDLMIFAFADPVPSDEAIAAKGLTPDEAMLVGMIVGMRRANADDPQLAEMRRVMAGLGDMTLSITADQLTFRVAGEASTGRYEVLEQAENVVRIRHHPPDGAAKEATFTLAGDQLSMADGAQTIRFRRK